MVTRREVVSSLPLLMLDSVKDEGVPLTSTKTAPYSTLLNVLEQDVNCAFWREKACPWVSWTERTAPLPSMRVMLEKLH